MPTHQLKAQNLKVTVRQDASPRLLSQQILLFLHLSAILRRLSERIHWESLPLAERRTMQRELASLKKVAQAARHRLKAAHKVKAPQ